MSDSIKCAFCNCELDFMTLEERESHYEAHFCEEQNVGVSSSAAAGQHSSSRIETGMQSVPKAITWQPRRKWPFPKETDVFWHPGMTGPPPKSCTPGTTKGFPFFFFFRRIILKIYQGSSLCSNLFSKRVITKEKLVVPHFASTMLCCTLGNLGMRDGVVGMYILLEISSL